MRGAVGFAVALLTGGISISACGEISSPEPSRAVSDTQSVTVFARDNYFERKVYRAAARQPVRLTVANNGQNVHEVEVKGLLPETRLGPGESKTIEVPAQQGRTFKIYCELHQDTGMEAELIIK